LWCSIAAMLFSALPSATSSSVRVALAASAALLALATGVGACGSGAQCALDSDCALGLRCNAANQCVPRGAGDVDAAVEAMDTGPRGDGGPTSDSGPPATDALRPDTGPPDVGATEDAPPDDGGPDTCPPLAPTYAVGRVGIGCMSSATMVSFMRLPDELCSYAVSSDRRADVEGTVMHDGTTFRGGLSFPDLGRICTVDVLPGGVSISCSGGCNIELIAP
jgi:hypothetical protein